MEPITKAIILAGGVDTFLTTKSESFHKSLLPVINSPLLCYTITNLIQYGVHEIFIACNSRDEYFFRKLLCPLEKKVKLFYFSEPSPRGTAGAISEVAKHVSQGSFWVIESGLFTVKLDFQKIVKFHHEQDAAVTIVAQRSHLPLEGISLSQSGCVEKIYLFHKSRDRRRAYTPCGIYLFNPAALCCIDAEGYLDLKEQLVPRLRDRGLSVRVYEINGEIKEDGGYVKQVRSLSDYYEVNWDIVNEGLVNGSEGNRKLWKNKVWTGEGTHISPSAHIVGPVVIGRGAIIEEDCEIIGPAVIGDHVTIESGSMFRESIALPWSVVPNNSQLKYAIWSDKEPLYYFRKNGHSNGNNGNGDSDSNQWRYKKRAAFYPLF